MNQKEVTLEEFLAQVGFGKVMLMVVDKKFFSIPCQVVQRPKKSGMKADMMVIHQSMRLKQ